MRQRTCSLFLVPSLLALVSGASVPAYGEEGGESSWKIVSASEDANDYQARSPLPAWEEPPAALEDAPARSTFVPRTQPVAPVAPRATTLQPTPPQPVATQVPVRPAARPIIPSRQLTAARQQHSATNQLTNEQIRAALSRAGLNNQGTSQMQRRSSIGSAVPVAGRQGKPFQVVSRDPTITPWLDLFRDEDLSQLPNYFTFVRPQFNQLEINRRNQADLNHLQREVQGVSAGVAGPQYGASGLPATGHRPRYMDTAQFYGRWQR
jgi:hypothetical protein